MITRKQKEEIVSQLKEVIKNSKSLVFTAFDKINVEDQRQLRKVLRENKCDYKVIKKSLIKIVLKDSNYEIDLDQVLGSIGIAYSQDDELSPVRESVEFSKNDENLRIIKGIFNGDVVAEAQLKELADLPSKEVLQGQVVGVIAAPLNGFVNVLQGNMSGLVNVLKGRADAVAKEK